MCNNCVIQCHLGLALLGHEITRFISQPVLLGMYLPPSENRLSSSEAWEPSFGDLSISCDDVPEALADTACISACPLSRCIAALLALHMNAMLVALPWWHVNYSIYTVTGLVEYELLSANCLQLEHDILIIQVADVEHAQAASQAAAAAAAAAARLCKLPQSIITKHDGHCDHALESCSVHTFSHALHVGSLCTCKQAGVQDDDACQDAPDGGGDRRLAGCGQTACEAVHAKTAFVLPGQDMPVPAEELECQMALHADQPGSWGPSTSAVGCQYPARPAAQPVFPQVMLSTNHTGWS